MRLPVRTTTQSPAWNIADGDERFRLARLEPDVVNVERHRAWRGPRRTFMRPVLEDFAKAEHEHHRACRLKNESRRAPSDTVIWRWRRSTSDGELAVQQCGKTLADVLDRADRWRADVMSAERKKSFVITRRITVHESLSSNSRLSLRVVWSGTRSLFRLVEMRTPSAMRDARLGRAITITASCVRSNTEMLSHAIHIGADNIPERPPDAASCGGNSEQHGKSGGFSRICTFSNYLEDKELLPRSDWSFVHAPHGAFLSGKISWRCSARFRAGGSSCS